MVINACPDCGGAIEIDFDFGERAILICWACGWEVEFKPASEVTIIGEPTYSAADDLQVTLKFLDPEDGSDGT